MRSIEKYIFILLFALLPNFGWADISRESMRKIEDILSEREHYIERQLRLIEQEEARLLRTNDKRERFEICYTIFNLSRSYKYDIAYKYSNEALNLAREIGDEELILRALASKLSTLTSGGLFTEAAEIVNTTNTAGVDAAVKREYLYNVVRFYSDLVDYVESSEYRDSYRAKLVNYADSIIMLSEDRDYYSTYATAYKERSVGETQRAIDALSEFYGSVECSDHHDSIITFLLGKYYLELGDKRRGLDYLILSMQHDIRAAARENLSIKTTAQHLFEEGDTKLADRLINVAFDDAKFYNARHRNLEINTLLPIINEQTIQTTRRQRNILYMMLGVISILSGCAAFAVVVVRRKSHEIEVSKRTIEQQLQAMSAMNSQLLESNSIKEHYIIESLYKSNDSLKQMESLLKKIDTKVKNRLYDDLRGLYKDFNVKRERESFFYDFDRAFLKLFPNFIEEYNLLFDPRYRVDVEASIELPPEVRIFALMRLGITDNERISHFLDLSINTIYTYKTKVKSRTIISKSEFEQRILAIKLSRQ